MLLWINFVISEIKTVGPLHAEKVLELVARGWVHITIAVTGVNVFFVQRIAGIVINGVYLSHDEIAIAFDAARLIAIGCELLHRNAHGDAGLAGLALRAVNMLPAAAKSCFGKAGKQKRCDLALRIHKGRRGLLFGQITARVRVCHQQGDGLAGHGVRYRALAVICKVRYHSIQIVYADC